ncbi:MAG: ComF family protein [Candidatus Omnitrophica bacterium]|nr:ComF family protein [Candidatus Omnitrophota bacterium]
MVSYSPEVQQLLHLFKFHQKTLVRHIFGYLVKEFLRQYPLPLSSYDCLMPIPLYPVRLRERGYNQSLMIAQIIQNFYSLNVLEKTLLRVKPTQPQSILGQKERWTNVIGAFKMSPNFSIKDKSVLLVDDLLTTGATASQAAQTLKEAGAKRVGLFVIALAE